MLSLCARVRENENREIKLPFEDNVISLNHLYIIYALNLLIFCHMGLYFCFNMLK